MGSGGGGGGDSLHSHGTLWRSFFLSNQAGVESRAKVWFLDVLNPGLEGFDTVLGVFFWVGGGGVTPLIPMELWSKKKYF